VESRERVDAALGQAAAVDRPPVTAWGHDFLSEWSPTELGASTVARARRYGWDLVKLQPRACCFAEAFGADYRPSGNTREGPRLHDWAIRDVASWGQLPDVSAAARPLRDQVDALQFVAHELRAERPVYQTVFSSFTVASYLAADATAEASRRRPDLIAKDQSRAVRHLRERPDLLEGALTAIDSALMEFIRDSLTAGADGIFYAIGGSASVDALDPDEYMRLLLPHDLKVLAALATQVPVIAHLCGANLNFDLVRSLPVSAVSWSISEPGNPSLAAGRERSGIAVFGGVAEVADLVEGGPAAATRAVRAARKETGGRGLVVAPGCSVPPSASDASLAAMAAAATLELA
jgi:uroporphyrinogen decarboxylase